MKFHTTIRKGLVIAGFAAFALLPATMKAQEITNTEFNDGPNVTALAQPTVSQQANTNLAFSLSATDAVQASEAVAEFAGSQQPSAIPLPEVSTDTWITATLLAAVATISLYALALAKRANRALKSARGAYVSTRTA